TLTFDSTPTSASSNPVTSGGVYTALASKMDTTSLSGYALLNSPTFTGVPLTTTPSTADNSTKIASTAYVQSNLGNYLTTSSASSTYQSQSAMSSYALINNQCDADFFNF
ncbi:MAG: hypothetical protein ACXU7H_04550, partial [Burkholderiaceae bacterium]